MKLSISLFQSRVARRLFILFLFSSLVPIFTLAYLSYISLTKTLTEQSRQQLHQTAKTVGYTMVERLDDIHHELAIVASNYEKHQEDNLPANQFVIGRNARNTFLAMALKSSNGNYVPLFNGIDEFPNLTTSQRIYLKNGKPVITFSDYSKFRKKILMVVPMKSTTNTPDLLIAELNQKQLWDIESIIHNPAFACITTELYESLYCSSSDIKTNVLREALTKNNKSSATFNWRENDTDFTAYYWTIFLEGKFSAEPWLVVLSKPKFEDQASIENIKSIYPIVLVLSILLVILLTSNQIRKILTPLEQLKEATGKVASGNFNSDLKIKSNDEFEELGESFRNMAHRLDKQFKSMSAMADIDRTILSSSNETYIVDTVLRSIKDIIPCDYVLLSVLDRERSNVDNDSDNINNSILKNSISLLDAESKLLLAHKDYLLINSTQHAPDFAEVIIKKGVMSLVIYPIIINDKLQSVITLGFRETKSPHASDLKHGREMADRVAVALSNASKEEKIYEKTNFDALTKLPNRTLVADRLNQAVQRARRNGHQVAALLIDVDRFKNINDSLGHTAGDQLLIEISTRLCTVINETDTLGRLGGDEFAIILSDIGYKNNSASMITSTAENILNAIKYQFVIHHHEVTVSASIGIAMFPADTMHAEDLLRYAEIAMYHAKSQKKGAYQYYSKDINASSVAQLVLENNLRQAVRDEQLDLHYQPQFERETGKIVAAEALLRWNHPELGNISPSALLPIADTSGLIVPIGDWVLRKACTQIREWLDQGYDAPRVAINLSAHQFREQNLIKRVKQILKEFDLDVNYLELEITEDTIMTDIEQTAVTLRTLNEMGIRLAVDDFGTGYSSLSYLAKFPIQYLKIDQSFIKDISIDPNMGPIISAIVALAHSLRLKVIAEGIETQAQYDFLDNLNCDLFQGFLLGMPVPPDQLAELLDKTSSDDKTFLSK